MPSDSTPNYDHLYPTFFRSPAKENLECPETAIIIMHLICYDSNSQPILVERIGDGIPPYAILSHTWGSIEEEVTFKDIRKGRGRDKPGYAKILFCLKQAALDGLQYCWIDTCCIDKSSSAELSEAINSMFQWYRKANKCYVYLADVSCTESEHESPETWMPRFEQSRWFTRGWTLQELIAPTTVEFFSLESILLGDKIGLKYVISETTGVAVKALEGKRLGYFGFEERFHWAAKRKTTREEDAVYSLFGIFDVNMPILYGEGLRKAMARLNDHIDESLDVMDPPLNCLGKGQKLFRGQSLTSQDEIYSLTLQNDGDFVLSGPSGVLWASHTAGNHNVRSVTMEYDGNLVIHAEDGSKLWESSTFESARPRLMLLNDGNAVVRSLGKNIWATHTSGGRTPNCIDVQQKVYVNQPLTPTNGRYSLVLQDDGNLVVRGPSGVFWATKTGGRKNVPYFMLQDDGNLVVYREGHHAIWGSQSFARNRPRLHVQNDGNVVIYSIGIAIWATQTRKE